MMFNLSEYLLYYNAAESSTRDGQANVTLKSFSAEVGRNGVANQNGK